MKISGDFDNPDAFTLDVICSGRAVAGGVVETWSGGDGTEIPEKRANGAFAKTIGTVRNPGKVKTMFRSGRKVKAGFIKCCFFADAGGKI